MSKTNSTFTTRPSQIDTPRASRRSLPRTEPPSYPIEVGRDATEAPNG
jgi:hypothetical protein